MPRYKPTERNGLLLPVVLSEQIQPGSFEFALEHLAEHELDLSDLDAQFNNDESGASAYDARALLKIVLLAYSRGLISSRRIAHACEHNIQFIALSGDARPSYTRIAKFVRESDGTDAEDSLSEERQARVDALDVQARGLRIHRRPPRARRQRCLADPARTQARTDTRAGKSVRSNDDPAEQLRRAIDSEAGRALYSQRIGTVEPVFANIRHNIGKLATAGHGH